MSGSTTTPQGRSLATTGPTDWTLPRASGCPSWALTRWCAAPSRAGHAGAILAEHARLLELGATSTCWDQYWSWFEPNYNTSADGSPDEGDRLLEVGRAIHALVRSKDPRAPSPAR